MLTYWDLSMKVNNFNSDITSDKLNENMFKKFGTKVNLEKYTREQLEDYRNLLRTKVNQTEAVTGFNDLLSNESYQKDKFVLNILNIRIKEMLGEAKLAEPAFSKAQQQAAGIALAAKRAGKKPKAGTASAEMAKMSTKELKKFAKTKHKGLPAHKNEAIDQDNDGDNDFDDVQIARMVAGGVPKKKAIAKAHADSYNEEQTEALRPEKTPSQATQARKDAVKRVQAEVDQLNRELSGKEKNLKRQAGTPAKYPVKRLTKENVKNNLEETKKDKEEKAVKKAMSKKVVKGSPFGKSRSKPEKPKKDVDNPFSKGKETKMAKDNTKGKNPFAKGKKKAVRENADNYKVILEGLKRYIAEDEEGKAKDITAGSDMVNDFTSWMQRVGQYQTKSMIELADSIRSNFGQAEADAFKNTIQPALQSSLDALTASREIVAKAVAVLAGEQPAEVPMGAEPTGVEEPVEGGADTMNLPPEDEFGASDAAVGGAETTGREQRESKEANRMKKLNEEHELIKRLAG